MLDPREHKGRKGHRVNKDCRVSREFREFKVLREMLEPKGPLGLKDLRVFKDHRVMSERLEQMGLTAKLCSVEPSIRKQATVSTETSTSTPHQILFLVPRLLVPGERALPLSDPRELKVRKDCKVMQGLRVSRVHRGCRVFKVMQDLKALRGLRVFRDHRVISGRKDRLELMELMGRPC